MNIESPVEEVVNDIGLLVQRHIDMHKDSYITYSELVEKSKRGEYSLNGELREICPLINIKETMYGSNLISQENKRLESCPYLDDVAQALLADYARELQISKEKSLTDKTFDKYKLESGYDTAKERPYRFAKPIVFLGSTTVSTIALGYTLPECYYVNIGGMALVMGAMIGGGCWVIESVLQPLGRILKPLEKIMMLDYEMKDMQGTSIYENKLKKQYVRKLSQHIKKNYHENRMRA
jgi:hypothetical protein